MLRVLDIWGSRKASAELRITSVRGSIISMLGLILIAVMVLRESSMYGEVKPQTEIVFDDGGSHSDYLTITFNVTLATVPCHFTSVDIEDVTGTNKHDVVRNIHKWRLDSKGRTLGELEASAVEPEEHAAAHERELEEISKIMAHADDMHANPELLTRATFDAFTVQKHAARALVMVNFYAPWCSHCQRFEPVWKSLAHRIGPSGPIYAASVDCTDQQQLCREHGVRAYPSVFFFEEGKKREEYHGERLVGSILTRAHALLKGYLNAADKTKRRLHNTDSLRHRMRPGAFPDKPSMASHEGCRINGKLTIRRVPGNFHLHLKSPRYDLARTRRHEGRIGLDGSPAQGEGEGALRNPNAISATHIVHELTFGDPLKSYEKRALPARFKAEMADDDVYHFVDREFEANPDSTYKHYLEVVGHSFHQPGLLVGHEVNFYRYTAASGQYHEPAWDNQYDDQLDALANEQQMPSLMFKYDISPNVVRTQFARMSAAQFITALCAIVGGVYTIFGLVERGIASVVS
jgi:thiol-disulfide isomerase/thioredoxin